MKKSLLNICYTYAFKAALTASLAAVLFVSVPSSECWGALSREEFLQVGAASTFLGNLFCEEAKDKPKFNNPQPATPGKVGEKYKALNPVPQGRVEKGIKLMYQYAEAVAQFPQDLSSVSQETVFTVTVDGKVVNLSPKDINALRYAYKALFDIQFMTPAVILALQECEIPIPTDQIPNYPKITADSSTEASSQSKGEDSKGEDSKGEDSKGEDSKGEDSEGAGEAFKVVGQDGENAPFQTGTSSTSGTTQETAHLNIEYKIDPLSSMQVDKNDVDFTDVWKDLAPTKIVTVKVATNESQGVTLKGSSAGLTYGTHTVPCSVVSDSGNLAFEKGKLLLHGVQSGDVSLKLVLQKDQKTFFPGEYKGIITLEISGQA